MNKTDKLNEVIAFVEANPVKIKNLVELVETQHKCIKKQDKLIDFQDKIIEEKCKIIDRAIGINDRAIGIVKSYSEYIEKLEQLISKLGLFSEREYSVYIHILPNNTIYIGQTKQELKERWQNGRGYIHNNFFNNLIKKYGWNNIDHLLYKDNLTKFEADTIEKDLIRFYSENERITGRVVLNIKENN